MSFAKSWNAAIALVEGRPADVRKILSDPALEIDYQSISELRSRLETAVEEVAVRECCRVLKDILMDGLRLEPPSTDPAKAQAFFEGQEALARLIETKVESLENQLGEQVHGNWVDIL